MDGKQGWWVVFGAMVTLTITAAVGFFTTPVYIENMLSDMGWTLPEFTVGTSIWAVCAAIVAPIVGICVDRFGVRPVMAFGLVTGAVTQYALGHVQNLTQYYIIMGLTPISIMACTHIPLATLITHWFSAENRGKATGVAMFGVGIGGFMGPLITAGFMDAHGWRGAMTDLSLVLLLAIIPTVFFLKSPKGHATAQEELEHADEDPKIGSSLTLKKAMKTRTFWGISIADMLFGAVFTTFNIQLLVYLTNDTGNEDLATIVQSVYFLCMGVGIIVFGILGDVLPFKRVLTSCYLFAFMSIILLLLPNHPIILYAFAIIGGMAGGGRISLIPVALANNLGQVHMAAIFGVASTMFMVGSAVGPYMAALQYEVADDTQVVYYAFAVVLLLSTLLIATIRNERKVD